MSQDRPTGKLSFRHWLIHGCLQVLSEPQYGRSLVERAVREHVALPIAICRQAEEIADRIERRSCSPPPAPPRCSVRRLSGSGRPTTATPQSKAFLLPLSDIYRSAER
jgi:hypothetical protein